MLQDESKSCKKSPKKEKICALAQRGSQANQALREAGKRSTRADFATIGRDIMTSDSTSSAAATAVASSVSSTGDDPIEQLRSSMLQTLRRNGMSTLKYLGTTEVHTYAFSVAANAILSFFPAAVLLLTHEPARLSFTVDGECDQADAGGVSAEQPGIYHLHRGRHVGDAQDPTVLDRDAVHQLHGRV